MSIRPILIHPDPRLKTRAEDIAKNSDALQALIEDMFDTMYDAPGIGLAAPQIGIGERIFVIDCGQRDPKEGDEATHLPRPKVLINPVITWSSEDTSSYDEGCLSIPDVYESVTRPAVVRMSYQDRNFQTVEEEFSGLEATCVQHELDHLDGRLFIDYLSNLKRGMITRKMQKLKRERAGQ